MHVIHKIEYIKPMHNIITKLEYCTIINVMCYFLKHTCPVSILIQQWNMYPELQTCYILNIRYTI